MQTQRKLCFELVHTLLPSNLDCPIPYWSSCSLIVILRPQLHLASLIRYVLARSCLQQTVSFRQAQSLNSLHAVILVVVIRDLMSQLLELTNYSEKAESTTMNFMSLRIWV